MERDRWVAFGEEGVASQRVSVSFTKALFGYRRRYQAVVHTSILEKLRC